MQTSIRQLSDCLSINELIYNHGVIKFLLISISIILFLFILPRNGFAQSPVFVKRSGSHLILNGQAFSFSGANIHWLGIKDNNGGTYPSHAMIDDAFADANAMGMNVIRSHTLGISIGCPNCLVPDASKIPSGVNFINSNAWDSIDYAIKVAKSYNMRLIIPFTDEFHFYHGGIHTFLDWRGITDQNQFYVNQSVITDYKTYIRTIIEHVNSFTGVVNKNEPTILAWETGNELGFDYSWDTPQANWTVEMATYIKSIDPNHLVADGHPSEFKTWLTNEYSSTNIDMYSSHYPRTIDWINRDVNFLASYNKVYFYGEYTWININDKLTSFGSTTSTDLDKLNNFLSITEDPTKNISGDLFWELYDSGSGGGDAYTFHWPGDDSYMQSASQVLKTHIAKMTKSSIKLGDANVDGKTNVIDYGIWANHYAPLVTKTGGPSIGDFDFSGIVDIKDFTLWISNYGK
jgi:endo-1,4-beta-mannosidase